MSKFVFVDTNVLLHYRVLNELPWSDIVSDTDPTILLSHQNLKELDVIKVDPNRSKKIKQRARAWVGRLDEWFGNGEEYVQGRFRAKLLRGNRVNIDFERYGLTPGWQDDVLLATLLQFQNDGDNREAIFVTGDLNAKLRAKSLGIESLRLDDIHLLPDEPDKNELVIKDLHSKIEQYEKQLPSLTVKDVKVFKVNYEDPIGDFTKERYLASLKSKFSVFNMMRPAAFLYDGERYERDLKAFISESSKYYDDVQRFKSTFSRSIGLKVTLSNQGSSVASDVRVLFFAPQSYQFKNYEDYNVVPEKPRPPNADDYFSKLMTPMVPNLAHLLKKPPEKKDIYIHSLRANQVDVRLTKLVQHRESELPLLLLFYGKPEDVPREVELRFRIGAQELPLEVDGTYTIRY